MKIRSLSERSRKKGGWPRAENYTNAGAGPDHQFDAEGVDIQNKWFGLEPFSSISSSRTRNCK
jgi:hypothetical protein